MRKITLIVGMLAITSAVFSQACPYSFKRNNGGTCGPSGTGALLTLNYDVCPTVA